MTTILSPVSPILSKLLERIIQLTTYRQPICSTLISQLIRLASIETILLKIVSNILSAWDDRKLLLLTLLNLLHLTPLIIPCFYHISTFCFCPSCPVLFWLHSATVKLFLSVASDCPPVWCPSKINLWTSHFHFVHPTACCCCQSPFFLPPQIL